MTTVAFDGKDLLEVKKRTHYDKVFEKVTIIPLFYVGVFCFVNGKFRRFRSSEFCFCSSWFSLLEGY